MSTPRILLIQPPIVSKRYQLDGYCSQPQKGPFRWHPIDFIAFASAYQDQAIVRIFDAGADPSASAPDVGNYDIAIGLIGAYGFAELAQWYNSQQWNNTKLYLSGDIARHEPAFVFDQIACNGIVSELASPPTVNALAHGHGTNLWARTDENWTIPTGRGPFSWGIQPYLQWDHTQYRLPFTARWPFASTITNVGCPYVCDYCILSQYKFRPRDLHELEAELDHLAQKGARHLYVRDATLNATPKHLETVLPILDRSSLPWNAFFRVEGLGQYAKALKEAGCEIVQLGLDSPDTEALHDHKKSSRNYDIAQEIAMLRRAGLQVVGHFVLGLTDSPIEAIQIVRYALELNLDWMTVSPLMTRPGTDMWEQDNGLKHLREGTLEQIETSRRNATAAHSLFYALKPAKWTLLSSMATPVRERFKKWVYW